MDQIIQFIRYTVAGKLVIIDPFSNFYKTN